LEWEGIDGETAVETSTLNLKVTNQSDVSLNVGIGIECNGLLGKQAVVALGELDLAPGDEKSMGIPVTRLPIQNYVGASQLFAVAVVHKEGSDRHATVGSEGLYYRFDETYSSASFFSKAVLKKDFGGCIAGVCTGNADKEQVLGRIADGNGEFEEVTLSEQTTAETVDGKIIGYPEGMSVGQGDQKDIL
jgi:hypothetical protein